MDDRRTRAGGLKATARGDGEPRWASRQRHWMRAVVFDEDAVTTKPNDRGRVARAM